MSSKRKKWRAPNKPTREARQVFALAFPGEAWPKGWRVEWAGFMRGAHGLCIWGRRLILLSYADAKKPTLLHTLVHEFVHMLHPKARHGPGFERLVDEAMGRLLGVAP